MNFQTPIFFILLIPLVVAVFLQIRRQKKVTFRSLLIPAALVLLIVALTNPYWKFAPQPQIVKGVDLILLVDVSQSMFCEDGAPRRIDQARNFIRGMLPRFAGSSASLIYFAKDAQIGIPMTPDLTAIQVFLDSITPRMTNKPGTSSREIHKVLEDLLKMDSGTARKQKLILLFSDGEFQDDPSALVRLVASRPDTSLMTFLCGSKKSPVPEFTLSGNHSGAFSTPDPKNLQAAAAAANGTSFDLSRTTSIALEKDLLARAHDIEIQGKPTPDYQPYPFIAAALFLLFLYQITPAFGQIRKIVGERRIFAARVVSSIIVAVLTIGMAAQDPGAEFREALKEISQKKYEPALKRLQALKLEGASEEVDIAIGNIYFAQNQLDKAINAYSSALLQNPMNPRARWNWEVALKKKQNPSPPPDTPPPTGQAPNEVPEETKSLLKYFDQQESDLMKQNNSKKSGPEEFQW
jgi:Ca-activated chloride channel homolog